jgi:hypothetical protein
MSRESALLAALSSEPASTSELYERIGYATLTRLGLVPYHTFRAALARLSAAGLAAHETAGDGSTVWWIASSHRGDRAGDRSDQAKEPPPAGPSQSAG